MSVGANLNLNWSSVQKALSEGTFSGYKIGILETEKLFANFLKTENIPGNNIERQIDFLKKYLSQFEKMANARITVSKIISQPHFEISREQTREIISTYYQAMIDIGELMSHLKGFSRLNFKLRYFLIFLKSNLKGLGIFTLGIIALIFFISESSFGQKITKIIVNIIYFLFFKLLLWLIIVAVLIILLRKLMPKRPRVKIM